MKKKIGKQSKIITQQPKTIENPIIIDVKSVTIEHPKTSKLSKSLRQAKKVSQVGGVADILLVLYIVKQKKLTFSLMKKRP